MNTIFAPLKTHYFAILMFLFPIYYLVDAGDFDHIFNVMALIALFTLSVNWKRYKGLELKKNVLYLIPFVVYPLAIFLSQLARSEWRVHDYMNQSRFLLAIPVFIYLVRSEIDFAHLLEKALPIGLILSYVSTAYLFPCSDCGDRFGNNYSDVIAYGQLCFSLSLVVLTSIETKTNSKAFVLYKLIGAAIGFYISFKTQSRTGWLAIVPWVVMMFLLKKDHLTRGTIIVVVASVLGVMYFHPAIHERIVLAIQEFRGFSWNDGNTPYTSIGLRLSFYRIAWFLFLHRPWVGWGDLGWSSMIANPELNKVASREAIEFCYGALFHNELLTQSVRYGLLGVLAYLLIFLSPAWIALKHLSLYTQRTSLAPVFLLVILLTQWIAGMTEQVFNHRHPVMLYSLIFAGLLADIYRKRSEVQAR